MRPSSAPNYCEEEKSNSVANEHQQQQHLINQQIQNENSKDSGIFLKENVTVNSQQMKLNSTSTQEDAKNESDATGCDLTESSEKNNVTTLIINDPRTNDLAVDEQSNSDDERKQVDVKSISTLIENGDLIMEDRTPIKNTGHFFRQAPGSTGNNIAPPSYAIKSDEIEIKKLERPSSQTKLSSDQVNSLPSKSRISNIRDQFEQSTSVNKPKIRLTNKLTNFRIGSYSTNTSNVEEDIYTDNRSSYSFENARHNGANQLNNNQTVNKPSFRYLSSPVNLIKEQPTQEAMDEPNPTNGKLSVPIKKPNLNAIKFKEVALNEGKNLFSVD